MRKEVKLGMAIGGGVVALLIVYLLVAPPSSSKRGVQLAGAGAGGNANGNLVDPIQAADAANSQNPHSNNSLPDQGLGTINGNAAVEAQLKKTNTAQANSPQPNSAIAEQKPKSNGGSGQATFDQALANASGNTGAKPPAQTWTSNQAGANANGERSARGEAIPGANPKADLTATAVAQSGNQNQPSRPQGQLYFDPNGAWGGGVSSDGPSALGSARMPAKGNLVASGPGSSAGTGTVSGSTPAGKATEAAPNTHIVRSGETFSSMAQMAYGSAAYYPHILRANPNVNPNNLRPGMVINLPPASEVKATASASGAGATAGSGSPIKAIDASAGARLVEEVKIDPIRQYRVVAGDSLYRIGQKLYGKGLMGDKIYEANRQTIGADPRKLKLGMILQLPDPPINATAATGGAGASGRGTDGARPASGAEHLSNTATSSEPYFGNESDPK